MENERDENMQGHAKDPNAKVKEIARAINELDKNTPSDSGIDYKPLYYHLFNGVSDVITKLSKLQMDTEGIFLDQCQTPPEGGR